MASTSAILRVFRFVSLSAALFLWTILAAAAHPHVFVEARSEMVFNKTGDIVGVRQIWRFDAAFSAFALQGLDKNGDGKYSDEELKPLSEINVNSLKEYDYFTFLRVGGKDVDFVDPKEYWLDHDGYQLTLFFTLPVKEVLNAKGKKTELQVFDPVYFVAFELTKKDPFVLAGAPEGCTLKSERATSPDIKIAQALSAIPATQRQIPKKLQEVTETLTNTAFITCP